jgi:two-component system response regulator VicR
MTNDKRKILIVDDDMDYLTQLELQVKRFGFDVILAESQKEAEEKIKEIKPDLAILDLMMENQDSGFILAYQIKKIYPDVPVIIATAATSETGMVFGLDHEDEKNWIKADTYIEKSMRSDQLEREINKLLKI